MLGLEQRIKKNNPQRDIFARIVGLSLKTKLLISFLFIGIFPIILSGYYFFVQSYRVILENSCQYTMEMLFQVNKNIQSKIQAIDNISLSIVVNHSLISLLNESDEIKKGRNKREIEQYLRSILISSKEISSIVIIDKNGTIYGNDDCSLVKGFDLQNSSYYIEAVKHRGNNFWFGMKQSIVVFNNAKEPLVTFPTSAIIKSFYPYGDYVGFLFIDLRQSALMGVISDIYADKSGNILMLDRDKKLMLSTKLVDIRLSDDLFKNINGEKGSYNLKIGGADNLITYLKNERTGWYIVSIVPVEFLIDKTDKIKKTLFNISLIIIPFCILLSLLITISITKEFKNLKSVMIKVHNGEFDIRVNSSRKDEIGQLCNTFDTMIGHINDLIQKNYEQRIREKNAQLKALQAQIAPHFLYNALDSINWMLIEKNQYEVSNIIVALGDLLRYSISNKKDMVPIKDEIKEVNNYLMIQKLRFENRFEYNINIESDLNDKFIPKLLIQPIVENAVTHGIEKRAREGKIEIIGYKNPDNVIFEVKDNGAGMNKEKLASILDSSQERYQEKNHLGLSNVNQRIKLIYGQEYGIEVYSVLREGTCVVIKLPRNL